MRSFSRARPGPLGSSSQSVRRAPGSAPAGCLVNDAFFCHPPREIKKLFYHAVARVNDPGHAGVGRA